MARKIPTWVGFLLVPAIVIAGSIFIETFTGDTIYDMSKYDSRLGTDQYLTMNEALVRADEIGCIEEPRFHTHDDVIPGRLVYMPCVTHTEYEIQLEKQSENGLYGG